MAKYTLEDLDKVFSEPNGFDHPYVTAMNKMRDFLGDDADTSVPGNAGWLL